ncbi:MAG: LysM peptidoglycan-binding domain-containing protein [Oscillospiraceae bacterium]|jgi:GH25 family lysozyme M1 (1,4-beta-N-acetylmuramidase)|nr:LysM peptidoglycan-binding domain-containing protein [Oscillospiraceae bacterium]
MGKRGIDVSKWQGTIDWKKVKDNGVEFAIIREGYGKKSPTQIDKQFKTNYEGAKAAGIPVGVYHYSYADSVEDARLEAEFCLENIRGMQLEYPVCFDIEDKEQLKLNNRQRTDIVKAFCEEIEKAGYYAMFYCNLSWLNNYLLKTELLSKYDLWLAQWNVPSPAINCGIWQNRETGLVIGISGNTDINVSYKDYPAIMKSMGLNGFKSDGFSASQSPAPPAATATEYTTYTVVKGDSLWSIAGKQMGNGTLWERIKNINALTSTVIYPGQVLKIPK